MFLRGDFKEIADWDDFISSGRLFQSLKAQTANALSPFIFSIYSD